MITLREVEDFMETFDGETGRSVEHWINDTNN